MNRPENLYQVGPDGLSDYDWEQAKGDYQWFVFWYEDGGYDGSGIAAGLTKEGKIEYGNLGHCSCYGPMENWPTASVSVEEFLLNEEFDDNLKGRRRSPDDFDYKAWMAVVGKVKELAGKMQRVVN